MLEQMKDEVLVPSASVAKISPRLKPVFLPVALQRAPVAVRVLSLALK